MQYRTIHGVLEVCDAGGSNPLAHAAWTEYEMESRLSKKCPHRAATASSRLANSAEQRWFRGQIGLRYWVIIEQDEDGVYVAEVPALPGCVSQGRIRAEAIHNIKEAIEAYVESLAAHGEPVPPSISEA